MIGKVTSNKRGEKTYKRGEEIKARIMQQNLDEKILGKQKQYMSTKHICCTTLNYTTIHYTTQPYTIHGGGRQNNGLPKDDNFQISRICEYVMLHCKGGLRLQMELTSLISGP